MLDAKHEKKNPQKHPTFSFRLGLEFLWLQYAKKVLHINKRYIVPKDFFHFLHPKFLMLEIRLLTKFNFMNSIEMITSRPGDDNKLYKSKH